jgi:SAM-dependent methyltransferase
MIVKIHHHNLPTEYLDGLSMDLFERQWRIYRKIIENNYLFHREAYGMLHDVLVGTMTWPFRFLDLACGDATATVGALKGTRVAHYRGVDLSLAALSLASKMLATLYCDAELHHRDFVEALRDCPDGADIVWFGMSLHHLQTVDKLALMRLIRTIVDEDGMFLMFEPTSRNGENRQAYLERFTRMIRLQWTIMTPEERDIVTTHVQTADYPETASDWMAMGREAGFARAKTLFVDPTSVLGFYAFHP